MSPLREEIKKAQITTKLQSTTPKRRTQRRTRRASRTFGTSSITTRFGLSSGLKFHENLYFRSRRRCVQPPSRPESRRCLYQSNFSIDNERNVRRLEQMRPNRPLLIRKTSTSFYENFELRDTIPAGSTSEDADLCH